MTFLVNWHYADKDLMVGLLIFFVSISVFIFPLVCLSLFLYVNNACLDLSCLFFCLTVPLFPSPLGGGTSATLNLMLFEVYEYQKEDFCNCCPIVDGSLFGHYTKTKTKKSLDLLSMLSIMR